VQGQDNGDAERISQETKLRQAVSNAEAEHGPQSVEVAQELAALGYYLLATKQDPKAADVELTMAVEMYRRMEARDSAKCPSREETDRMATDQPVGPPGMEIIIAIGSTEPFDAQQLAQRLSGKDPPKGLFDAGPQFVIRWDAESSQRLPELKSASRPEPLQGPAGFVDRLRSVLKPEGLIFQAVCLPHPKAD
jgi:hypothetical protein